MKSKLTCFITISADGPHVTDAVSPLSAEGAGQIEWSSATLECDTSGTRPGALLREGTHTITGRTADKSASTWIVVRAL